MKKFRLLAIIMAFTFLLGCGAPAAFAIEDPDVGATAVVLADFKTGEIIFSRNMAASVNPASLTKIMTVLLAVEAIENGTCSLDEEITAGDDCLTGMDELSSTANITPGEVMTMEGLLYCSMLGSANEACNIIATHLAGSISAFCEQMNMKAASLGCTDTSFADPNGLSNADRTTAYDFYLITKAAAAHQLFMTICDTTTYIVPVTNKSDARTLNNSNALISPNSIYAMDGRYLYEYASGIKTGYTSAAGYCLISTAEKDDVRLVAVVMGCQGPNNSGGQVNEYRNFADSITLYNWAFDNFSYQTVLESTADVCQMNVKYGSGDSVVTLRPENKLVMLVPNDFDPNSVTLEVTASNAELIAPIEAGAVLGTAVVKINGQDVGTVKLVSSSRVELSRAQYMKERFSKAFNSALTRALIIIVIFVLSIYGLMVVRYRTMRKRHIQEKRLAEQRRREQREAERSSRPTEHRVPVEPTQTFRKINAEERTDRDFTYDEVFGTEDEEEEN